jgi:hypothetical protein
MGSYLGRDAILAAHDLEVEEVHVPQWADPETGDDLVRVKALTGAERDAYEASCTQDRGKQGMVRVLANIRAKLVVRCLVDAEGNRIFKDTDASALGEKSSAALDRLFEVAARLSRLSEEDVEEMGKASAGTLPEDSSSDSPASSDAP